MFSSKSKTEPVAPVSGNKIDTIIGEKTRVEGTLHTQDTTVASRERRLPAAISSSAQTALWRAMSGAKTC